MTILGLPSGKTSSSPSPEDVRMVLPQTALLTLFDVLLSTAIHKFLNLQFPTTPAGAYIGGRKRTQPMEIAFAMQLCVDKSLDDRSSGCLAQGDIQKYFDSMPMVEICAWLCEREFPAKLFALVVRHQILTSICVYLRNSRVTPKVRERGTGSLTGSRTAGALARLPIEDMISVKHNSWCKLGFHQRLNVGCWVDNLYVASSTPCRAVAILCDAEDYLENVWHLRIKESSKMFMPMFNNGQEFSQVGWAKVSEFPVLGHIVQDNGACNVCFRSAVSGAWRAFWANLSRASTGPLSLHLKLRHMTRVVNPIIFFRASRWPFSSNKAKLLDRTQRHMIRIMLGIRMLPGEDMSTFARRAGHAVLNVQRNVGSWGFGWARNIISWAAHVLRNNADACWGARVLDFRSSSELDERRRDHGNRPHTRFSSGFTNRRWTDGVSHAINFLERPPASFRKYIFAVSSSADATRLEALRDDLVLVKTSLHMF